MAAASLKPEVALLDNDDMSNMTDNSEWQFVPLGEQQNFGIRTSGLEDKASACEMLVCYARELKTGFAPYAEDVVKLMVPLLKFYFHDNVRIAAAQSMPSLLECAETRGMFKSLIKRCYTLMFSVCLIYTIQWCLVKVFSRRCKQNSPFRFVANIRK